MVQNSSSASSPATPVKFGNMAATISPKSTASSSRKNNATFAQSQDVISVGPSPASTYGATASTSASPMTPATRGNERGGMYLIDFHCVLCILVTAFLARLRFVLALFSLEAHSPWSSLQIVHALHFLVRRISLLISIAHCHHVTESKLMYILKRWSIMSSSPVRPCKK